MFNSFPEKNMAKSSGKAAPTKKRSGKRELIAPKGDKRYVHRDEKGHFTKSADQGKSLSQDVKKTAKTKVKPGYGDRGDQSKKK
jgi:hypothetical protein